MGKVVKIICLFFIFTGSVLLTIAGSFRSSNTKTKRKRKMKTKDILSLCKYRRMMAFYHDFMGDFEWLNRDMRNILNNKFISNGSETGAKVQTGA